MRQSAVRTMPIFYKGRAINVPIDDAGAIDVESVKRLAGISSDRILVQAREDGQNQVLPAGGRAVLPSGGHVADIAPHRRGVFA